MSADQETVGQLAEYQINDRYQLTVGRVYLTGSQALVRLPMMQRQRDAAAGLNTAGFISGYTGSPLGGYDIALKQAQSFLEKNNIHFQPGINEDLGAAAVCGSQQIQLMPEPLYDGVFSIWYGKGPGVDRSGDALKHGSYAGAAANGGVLVLAGDDHAAKSSTTAHQSDHAFIHFGMPYFNPANVQDYLDLGLHAFALSRFSGCWVGMKCITDTVESSASVSVDPHRVEITLPTGNDVPQEDLNIRWGVPALAAELRQYQRRLPAVQAYVRANKLDRAVISSASPKLGIMTSGKAFLDVMQALDLLGLEAADCDQLGLSVYKIALPWPLEPVGAVAFASAQKEILLVEEKRPIIEDQMAKLLFNQPSRPSLLGKFDAAGLPLINAEGELDPSAVAIVIGERLAALNIDLKAAAKTVARLQAQMQLLCQRVAAPTNILSALVRTPSFCAGCPHNRSTKLPDGSMAFGGIGCHGMATFLPERNTPTLFHMGAEGAPWIGIAPFSGTKHIFQNLGDGTYYHSGLLAIRATVAAGVNITYKILVNDAIAMTGGQHIEGQVQVDELTRQVHAEGVRRIAVVSGEPERYKDHSRFAEGVTFHHRDDLDPLQRELRETPGVSAMIYDQYCATELRRRRKRGTAPDPDQRIFINERVCEGCGDCSVQSNCIAVEPVETEFGRKRRINQSACNKDFSCLNGYCPSFVTLQGATPRKGGTAIAAGFDVNERAAKLPLPSLPDATGPYNILLTGIGGSGVVTLGALLGMAAHLEGKGCSVLDMSGLAQRNGPVTSHVRIAASPEELHANRIATADLVIGSDIVVTAGREVLAKIRPSHTHGIINSHVAPTAAFASHPDLDMSASSMTGAITAAAGNGAFDFVEATELSTALLGTELGANLFLIGYAAQRGWLPISLAAIERAIELNGTAVAMNKAGLNWGRLAAHDIELVRERAGRPLKKAVAKASLSLADILSRNRSELRLYQNKAYAGRYDGLMAQVAAADEKFPSKTGALSRAVAQYYYKLLAYKDEYEVARLYSAPEFRQKLEAEFEGSFKIVVHLAPPILQGRDPDTGRYKKRAFGPWIFPAFRLLAKLKPLRGTPFDIFGYSKHRREERKLIKDYEVVVAELLSKLTAENYDLAVEIASLPEKIRGYDLIKESSFEETHIRETGLLAEFRK